MLGDAPLPENDCVHRPVDSISSTSRYLTAAAAAPVFYKSKQHSWEHSFFFQHKVKERIHDTLMSQHEILTLLWLMVQPGKSSPELICCCNTTERSDTDVTARGVTQAPKHHWVSVRK